MIIPAHEKKSLILFLCIAFCQFSYSQTIIFPYATSWKYLDDGSNQGTAWRATGFSDASWKSGTAQLGYGDGDETTVVSYGTNASQKYVTTYFRKTFTITGLSSFANFTMSLIRDDGAVIYVNGTEVARNNLPSGTIAYNTLATASIGGTDETTAVTFTIAAASFVEGSNTIAVEMHQQAVTSSDISFSMQLTGNAASSSSNTFIPLGSSWKYLDNNTRPTGWNTSSFNDAAWVSGNAELGYGDGGEATVVSYGTNSSNKYITTYFRKTISITDPSQFVNFTFNIVRDDGIVVYVNGTEVIRNNLPTGTIAHSTLASAAIDGTGESQSNAFTVNTSYFIAGNNTIAVEIHQSSVTSSDISFNLSLVGNVTQPPPTVTLTRGPYLQMGNQTALTLRWRTNTASNSRVQVGTVYGTYPTVVNDATSTTEHEVRVTGLIADTKYFYTIGSSTQILQSGNDNFFTTVPAAGTRKLRFAVFGDCGRNDNSFQSQSLQQYRNYLSTNGIDAADAMLLLGDNAYDLGTDAEFTSKFFNIYSPNILKNHKLYPSPGNHDYANSASRQVDHAVPYYSIFTLPTHAECGGVASNNEAFYSYDIGDVHFLSLNSYGLETGNTRMSDTTGPQVTWIKNDLAANTKKWVVAYWHHPPYTMAGYSSDTQTDLVNIREKLNRILERYGVDLILCGHSHDYERSYLLKGYYKVNASDPTITEKDFNPAIHTASQSSAKYNNSTNSCPYVYNAGKTLHGTVYVVSGSSGADGGVQAGYPHNALPFAQDDGGMFYFEVNDNRLDGKFIRRDGVIADQFTVMHDVNKNTTINVAAGSPVTLTASWVGNYSWNTSATTRSLTVTPSGGTTVYTVKDNSTNTCITDTFTVNVTGTSQVNFAVNNESKKTERSGSMGNSRK